MSHSTNVWGKLLSIFLPRAQRISPEVAEEAQYSYRNYRCEEGTATAPRSQSRPRSSAESFVNAAPSSAEIQFCRS